MLNWCSCALFLLIGISKETQTFEVFWNVPSSICKQFGIDFDLSSYNITQNINDEFFGEQIGILYDPAGLFPVYTSQQGTFVPRNGGIPQLGNMSLHLDELKKLVDLRFPDTQFAGLGVLDMEAWRPLWNQNFPSNPSLNIYRTESIALERERLPCWTPKEQEKEAERRFELFARAFLERTLEYLRALRPRASWGYYIYPGCFNYSPDNNFDCPASAKRDNDAMGWLFSASGALFPSAYISTMDPAEHRDAIIWYRMEEGRRVAENVTCSVKTSGPDVLPYIRYRYADKDLFLSESDLNASLRAALCLKLRGVVIWGSSGETNSRDKCQRLLDYINTTLGPSVRAAVRLGQGQARSGRSRASCAAPRFADAARHSSSCPGDPTSATANASGIS